jgi:stage II sporulation protein D
VKISISLLVLGTMVIHAADVRVQLRTANGTKIVTLPLETYVPAVLAGEASVFQSPDALKAMAVAARTYAVRTRGRHSAEGFDFCDTTHCQRLDIGGVRPRLEKAAQETSGELLWYQGKVAFTPYSRDCGGRTEDAAAAWPDLAAPYLKSHDDPYCVRTGTASWQWNGDPRKILTALRDSQLRVPRELSRITILDRTSSRRAATLVLAGPGDSVRISSSSFRFAVGRELGWNTLRSDRYEVHESNGRLVFDGTGSGHGVGLCQDGAEQMGKTGSSYRDILSFYYPGTIVGLTARGLSWGKLRGEILSLETTQPEIDRVALAEADQSARRLTRRTGWAFPPDVVLRVYPNLDAYRDSTGEPGWVAGYTAGSRIHLQPVSVLQPKGVLTSSIRHELLHVLVEAQAKPGLPFWFREGIVEYLVSGPGTGEPRIPPDVELRQTSDRNLASRAYASAQAQVGLLARRYGEGTVLTWVSRGLPADVAKASASQPATKNR